MSKWAPAVGLAWLVPGGGHFLLRRSGRGEQRCEQARVQPVHAGTCWGQEMQRELQIVQQENQSLADRSNRDWFLLGAGVLVSGVLVGLILPRLRVQRRSRWGEL